MQQYDHHHAAASVTYSSLQRSSDRYPRNSSRFVWYRPICNSWLQVLYDIDNCRLYFDTSSRINHTMRLEKQLMSTQQSSGKIPSFFPPQHKRYLRALIVIGMATLAGEITQRTQEQHRGHHKKKGAKRTDVHTHHDQSQQQVKYVRSFHPTNTRFSTSIRDLPALTCTGELVETRLE